MTTARATSSHRRTAPVDDPVPIADPTAENGLLPGAGSACDTDFAFVTAGGFEEGVDACCLWCLCRFTALCFTTAGAGAGVPASPLEFARFSTALPAGPCFSSALVVEFDTGCECFLWWPELPPGAGSASQYWSMADVPGGAWQVVEELDAPAGWATSAHASSAPRKAILHV